MNLLNFFLVLHFYSLFKLVTGNMVLDLKLSRLQDVPWGFRLAGGIDYDLPLTVIKV